MLARYVVKGFRRHIGRTIIMILALAFVAMMLVVLNNVIATTRRQVVDLVAQEVGAHDIDLVKKDTSQDLFIDVAPLQEALQDAHPAVNAIYPRFHAEIELALGSTTGSATLVARDPDVDKLGTVTMLEGEYDLSDDHIVVLRNAADAYNLRVGDEVDLSYVLPMPRTVGEQLAENISVNRITHRFKIAGIALQDGLGQNISNGVLAHVATVQEWLNMSGRAERLVIALDPAVYNTLDVKSSVFRVRRVAEQLQATLGSQAEEYTFKIEKAESLDGSEIAFSMIQTMVMVYGILSMGVVGLLVYSLINANVDDRRRDLAFLRILGARRYNLFSLVLIEVFIVGAIGIGLGTIGGQALSTFLIDRVVISFISGLINNNGGIGSATALEGIDFTISPWSLVSTAAIAGAVLLLSAIAPARKAARTKIRYALNPGSADNLQVEDLAALRERKYDWNITIAGIVLTVMWGLIFVGQNFLFAQGDASVLGAFMFGGMALLILGVSLLFFTLTVPFERLSLLFFGLFATKLTFFASRNVKRAKQRNTVIALMIVFSATLPTFLGTTAALTEANFDVSTRQRVGADINAEVWRGGFFFSFFNREDDTEYLRPDFLPRFTDVEGVGPAVGLTYTYRASTRNKVKLRSPAVGVQGLTDSPLIVTFTDLTSMVGDGEAAFRRMFNEPDAVIVTAGFADYMDLKIGDTFILAGQGLDHDVEMHIVGLAERMSGYWTIDRSQRNVQWGASPAFVSMDTFVRLTTDPNQETVCLDGWCSETELDKPIIQRVMARMDPSLDPQAVVKELRKTLADRTDVSIEVTTEQVRVAKQGFQTTRVVLLILTILSLITSVLGVFSVIYVTVQTRRMEIGMLKAVGITGWQLVGTFAIESLSMTISATMAGTTAGTGLGYVFYWSNNMMQNVPTLPAFDWLTVSFVLVMVIVASLISAILASRSIVHKRVTAIMRGA
ncbi:MAG: ABC transporter permease [Anaerolineae bacterium]|nr:ABC transporter permease [Anaerolineae bacterium]